MELWFWVVILSAVFAGVSNFYFKQAAARGYSAELFSFYGGIFSVLGIGALVLVFDSPLIGFGVFSLFAFLAGVIAGLTNIFKILALRFIDSTVYFPLYKLLAPAIAIIVGVTYFGERFTLLEWFGMALGLLVPLILITPSENKRQNNLLLGLILIALTAATSASSAVLNKLATDAALPLLTVLMFTSFGVVVGSGFATIKKWGVIKFIEQIKENTSSGLVFSAVLRAFLISLSLAGTLYAFANGGTLAVVQTIHSMYILIPIVLAIIFYNEHWNWQKVLAIVLSVVSLAFLG
jgi:drug/metabolite transporter (DMT)-like permease